MDSGHDEICNSFSELYDSGTRFTVGNILRYVIFTSLSSLQWKPFTLCIRQHYFEYDYAFLKGDNELTG